MCVSVNMTTSPDCVTDLENITLELHHESKLIFKGIVWDDLSLSVTSIQEERKFTIHVSCTYYIHIRLLIYIFRKYFIF